MNSFWRIAVYIGLPFSVIGTIFCICRLFFRTSELGFDYMGVIVGVLSFIVTFVLGWQIYSVINMKKSLDEMKSITNRRQEETMARAYTSIMNQTSYKVEGRKDNDDCYNAVANGLFACKHYHLAGNEKGCTNLLAIITSFKKGNCKLTQKNINDLLVIIGQLKECGVDVSSIEVWINSYNT